MTVRVGVVRAGCNFLNKIAWRNTSFTAVFFLNASIWWHIMTSKFRSSFTRSSLQHVFIIISAASKLLVVNCFGIYSRWFIRNWIDFIDPASVLTYDCFALNPQEWNGGLHNASLLYLPFDAYVTKDRNTMGGLCAAWAKSLNKMYQPKYRPFLYTICVTFPFKLGQKTDNGIRVEE